MIWNKHVPAHSMVICLCLHLTAGQLFYIMFIYFHLHLLYCHFSVLETPVFLYISTIGISLVQNKLSL